MSKKKSTFPTGIVLFCLAIAGVGLAYWDYQRNQGKEVLTEHEVKLLDIPQAEIAEISMKTKKETIGLKRQGEVFVMNQPVNDETDDFAVSSYINAIAIGKLQKITDKDSASATDWGKYGLDPGVQFDVVSKNGVHENFTVSDSSAFDGSFFVKKHDQLYVIDRGFARISTKAASDLRSRKIWRDAGDIVGAKVKLFENKTERSYQLTKVDDKWSMEPSSDLSLDPDKIKSWVEAVKTLQAVTIAAEKLEGDAAKSFQLDHPSAIIEFAAQKDGASKVITWTFGQDRGEDVYLQLSSRSEILKLSKSSLRDIRVSSEKFLNTKEIFKIPVEKVRSLQLARDGKVNKFIKENSDWKASTGEVKPDQMAELFSKLSGLQPDIESPPKGVAFRSERDRLMVELVEEKPLEIQWSNEINKMRWVKSNRFKEAFKVPSEQLSFLLNFNGTTSKEEKKEDSAKKETKN